MYILNDRHVASVYSLKTVLADYGLLSVIILKASRTKHRHTQMWTYKEKTIFKTQRRLEATTQFEVIFKRKITCFMCWM